MGRAAALCSGGTRGLVSILGAVPCLACENPPGPAAPAMSAGGEPGRGGGAGLGAPAAPDTYKGWLFKWTNYLKGYQRRWFVLSNGLLSYYRTQAEMAHTCRGTINLSTAHIDTEDSCNIVLSNGGRTYHLKASSEVERQRWVTALELAKAKAIRMRNNQSDDSGDEEPTSQSDKSELHSTLKSLASKLEDLSTCNDLIAKHGAALQRSLSELENLKLPAESGEKIKAVNERATLFRITSNAMINCAVQELESLRGALERSQKGVETLESCRKETRSKADEARADMLLLEYRRDSCLQELPEREKALSTLRRRRSTLHSTQLGAFQAEVSSLAAEREELKAHVRHLEGSLFSEQRAARARIKELQECLEQAQNKLEERTAEGMELQEETTRLRLQLRELERKQAAALSGQVRDLRVWEREQELRLFAMEKILSEKELKLVRLREVVCALMAEKEVQQRAMENLREEHDRQLGKMQQEKELEWAQQREELQRLKQQELQEFAESLEQVKARALQDQAASFQKEVENLTRVLEARDEDIRRQREAMQRQKESTEQLVRELKQEAKETVQSALLQEQKKWEAEKREALQVQRGTLEEQSQRAHAEALDKERRTVSVLQNKTLEFQKRIQELELHSRSLQREKKEALEELWTLLQEEKMEALRRLSEELEQERAHESDRLRARLQQLEEEQSHLRAERNEMSLREWEAQSQAEQAERSLAREIGLACQRLQDLLPERARGQMAHGSPSALSTSHALQLLQGVSEETQRYLGALQQELEAQKRTMLHFQEEKQWELRQQREQLHLESKEALEALKERLIQEHLQEIASLQRSQLKEAGGGEQQTLRQQLREKDNELWAIQRCMAHWKDQTTCKLARKFEEELNAERETRFSWDRPRGLRRSVERLDAEIGRLSTDRHEHTHLCPTTSSSLCTAPQLGGRSFVSSKLLRQLQGRVRELRAENALYRGGSLDDLAALRAEPGQTGREKVPGASYRK
ncbi:unnamed protein product [Natator depressus]